MKKMIFALVMMLTATVSASAMSYERARNEALFLTDKMAYELNLTDAQYEAAYEINLDYLMGVTSVDDVYGIYWERRNLDLSYILYQWQWDAYLAASYFYRPLYWSAGHWHFGIYARYTVRDYFYFGRPHFYATYRGGHAWHLNGGRSWYHGRADHFRPALRDNRQHFGMRSQWDRGDFRGRSHSNRSFGESRSNMRNNSSTRVTAGHNQGAFGRSQGDTHRENRTFGNGTRDDNRSFGNGTRSENRSFGNGERQMNRNFGNSDRSTTTTSPSRSTTTTTPSAPTRSFGNHNSVGSSRPSTTTSRLSTTTSRPSSSMSSTRSSSHSAGSSRSTGSSRSSNSHGHFGGRR